MSKAGEIRSVIAERLKYSTGSVSDRVVDALVEKELAKRVELILAALGERDRLKKEQNKLKPDNVSYDADGKIVGESFSKGRLDELNKNKAQLEKLEKAIDAALTDGDFSKLSK